MPPVLPQCPGETLLDNDTIVVQRFIIPPGQWEGVHKHPPNQLYIHVKGGEWTVRFGDRKETSVSPDGEVGWSNKGLGLDADHEVSEFRRSTYRSNLGCYKTGLYGRFVRRHYELLKAFQLVQISFHIGNKPAQYDDPQPKYE